MWNSGKLFQFLHKGKNLAVVKSSVQATASLEVAEGKATGGIEQLLQCLNKNRLRFGGILEDYSSFRTRTRVSIKLLKMEIL